MAEGSGFDCLWLDFGDSTHYPELPMNLQEPPSRTSQVKWSSSGDGAALLSGSHAAQTLGICWVTPPPGNCP